MIVAPGPSPTRVQPPSSSAVVVAFHRPDALRRLGAALADAVDEVVIVNVNADPEVTRVAGEVRGFEVVTADNVGFGAAVNLGVACAHGDVVVVCNDDLVPDDGAVARLVGGAASGAVMFPVLVGPSGALEPGAMALPTPWKLLIEWALLPDRPVRLLARVVKVEKWRSIVGITKVEAASAAMFAAPRRLLVDCPIPDTYFLYWEEIDWCWQLRTRGQSLYVDAGARVYHSGGRDDVRADKCRLMVRNAVQCVRRTQGRVAAATAVPVVVLWSLRLLVSDLLAGGGAQRRPARLAGVRAALMSWQEV
ncbi:MAG: glycosyltransferase family 2 protein [Acidimicrobiales bacterium]